MPKGYLLSAHRSPADPEKREAYLKLAGPAIEKAGGKVLASTKNVKAFENGREEQTVLVEFESFAKAVAAYERKEPFLLFSILSALYARADVSNRANERESNNADLPVAFGANNPIIPLSFVKSTTLSSP